MQSEYEVYSPFVAESDFLHSRLVGSRWRDTHRAVGAIANGWYLRCQRGTEAAGLLEDEGFGGETTTLRRSVVEHSVALRWLAAEGEAILDTLKRGHANAVSGLLTAWAEAGWEGMEVASLTEMVEELLQADKANDVYLQFQSRVNKYGVPDDVAVYRAEAGLSHPTYESAMAYWDEELKTSTDQARSTVSTWRQCTFYLVEALQSLASTFEPNPIAAEVRNLEARLRLVDGAHQLGFR